MTTLAKTSPIDSEIVSRHVEQAARALAEQGADALLLFKTANMLGFCSTPLGPNDRLVCGLVSESGQVAVVVPAFEAAMVGPLPPGGVVVTWEEDEDPYAATAEAAKRIGVSRGRILLDPSATIEAHARFSAALHDASVVIDPGIIREVRIRKTSAELLAITAACRDTGKIYPLISAGLRAGISEKQLAVDVLQRLRDMGMSPYGELIQGGETASVPHQHAGARTFRDGDAVIVDFVCSRVGYLGDMTRTFALGAVSDEIKRAYDAVRRAQRAAIKAIRPGVTCGQVDSAARSVIESAGLGEFFTHRTGHGIGLEVHEPPYLVKAGAQRLEPGMVVTVEPGVYVPGQFGIRIEDVVAVTESGHEVLSADVATDVSPAFA
jgi:Xaa-Pro aminopeptidase